MTDHPVNVTSPSSRITLALPLPTHCIQAKEKPERVTKVVDRPMPSSQNTRLAASEMLVLHKEDVSDDSADTEWEPIIYNSIDWNIQPSRRLKDACKVSSRCLFAVVLCRPSKIYISRCC